MKNILRAWMIIFVSLLTVSTLTAREVQMKNTKQGSNLKQTTAGCAPASAYDWLDINNVRARINTGGDMWWDLPGGVGSKYFIPKLLLAFSAFPLGVKHVTFNFNFLSFIFRTSGIIALMTYPR